MKTSEFKKELDKLGFSYKDNYVISSDDLYISVVDEYERFEISTNVFNFYDLPLETQQKLWSLMVEYATTPVEKREDEVKFKVHVLKGNKHGYINQVIGDCQLALGNRENSTLFKTIFTKFEWDKIRGYLPAYDKDNPMFEIVGAD